MSDHRCMAWRAQIGQLEYASAQRLQQNSFICRELISLTKKQNDQKTTKSSLVPRLIMPPPRGH